VDYWLVKVGVDTLASVMSRTATAARGGATAGQRQRQRREVRVRCQAVQQPPPLPRSALRRNTLGGSELVVSEVGKRPLVHVA
jgi:hypothetical protein